MDLAHAVLGALLLANVVIAIAGFVHLHQRCQIVQGVAAATLLTMGRLDQFMRSSAQSSSNEG